MLKHFQCGTVVACAATNSGSIFCGTDIGNICLVSTKTSEIVWTNKISDDNSIRAVAVSSNKDIVVGGGSGHCLFVVNAGNGKTICSVDVGSWIRCVLFLSQQKIACGLGNGTVVIVCWQTQKIEKILKIGERTVFASAISPVNDDILLTGDGAGVIKQTIISSEKTVMVYEGHIHYVKDLSFLCGGNLFVSVSGDHTARLFALDQKQAIRVFEGHTSNVCDAILIHDDELLITISYDNTVKLWNIESGECLSTIKTELDVYCGAVSKDEKSLIVGGRDGKLTLFSCPPRFPVSLDRSLKLCK